MNVYIIKMQEINFIIKFENLSFSKLPGANSKPCTTHLVAFVSTQAFSWS